jgi:glycosyltransferase involved in cell wall biosynthesis
MTTKKTKIVLSLGRLHPLKGLDLLISAWAEVREQLAVGSSSWQSEAGDQKTNALLPWQLVIAGPDEQGTKEKLKGISDKLKLRTAEASDLSKVGDADIVFLGAVQGEEKWNLIKKADIFVLPSRSENFGIVVGEALSCGVPVVTTAVGPWGEGRAVARPCRDQRSASFANRTTAAREAGGDSQLPTAHRGLIVVETSVEGIAQGLQQMMALSDDERHELGQQGADWVKREFSWERVAKQMIEAYEGEDEL